jgi:hypothetical protein
MVLVLRTMVFPDHAQTAARHCKAEAANGRPSETPMEPELDMWKPGAKSELRSEKGCVVKGLGLDTTFSPLQQRPSNSHLFAVWHAELGIKFSLGASMDF